MLYHMFMNRTTCVWPSADSTVKPLKLQWTGGSQTSSWFLAWCCSVKDILAAFVYRIHRYRIPSARQTAKYNMLFSSTARKWCKHCQAVGFSSQLRLSFFHLSTTIVTKLDFFGYNYGFLKRNKLSLFDPQFVRDRWPFQRRVALYSHSETTHHTSCCCCWGSWGLTALFEGTSDLSNVSFLRLICTTAAIYKIHSNLPVVF